MKSDWLVSIRDENHYASNIMFGTFEEVKKETEDLILSCYEDLIEFKWKGNVAVIPEDLSRDIVGFLEIKIEEKKN